MARHYGVLLTEDAERDIEELFDYIAQRDSPAAAYRVLDGIERSLGGLAAFPERGSVPKELLAVGIRDYRQVFHKPYRLIYRIVGTQVFVYLVVDGRRDMESLLARRLLDQQM